MSKDVIKDYGDDSIEEKSGIAAVRHRAGMYIGDVIAPEKGQLQILKEITDNCFDEVTAQPYKQHTIHVTFLTYGNQYQVIVSDTGRGLPLGKLKTIFTKLHSSGKWGASYGASSGTNGVGSTATAALSSKFCAISKRRTGSAIFYLRDSKVITNKRTKKTLNKDEGSDGSTILFQPDKKIFPKISEFLSGDGYKQFIRLMELIPMFLPNVVVKVHINQGRITEEELTKDIRTVWHKLFNQHSGNLTFMSDPNHNMKDYITKSFKVKSDLLWSMEDCTKTLNLHNEQDLVGYDIKLYVFDELEKTKNFQYTSLVNNTPINDPTSHHISALHTVLKNKLKNYITNKEFTTFFDHIYKLPIHAAISAQFKGATFVNQIKTEFKDDVFYKLYTKNLKKTFSGYPDSIWSHLYKVLQEDIQEKYNIYNNRSIKSSKGLKDMKARLANSKSYIPCRSNDNTITELFITEGESAGGVVSTARNKDFQAVYKLKGKSLNTFKASTDKSNSNVVYNDLIKVLGVSPSDTNLDSLNFHRICILTDADSDGYHITTLIVGNLYSINPLILEQGKVYVSNPPLYLLSAKDKSIFLRDTKALIDIKVNTLYNQAFELYLKFNNKKKLIKLEGESFKDFCCIVEHIGSIIHEVSNTVNVEPFILEQLIHVVDYIDFFHVNTSMIKQILGLDDVVHHKESNSLILAQGGIEIHISLNKLKEEITGYILPELEKIHWSEFDCLVTTKHTDTYNQTPISIVGLHTLFKTLDERNPAGSNKLFQVSRFKGLGECSQDMIAYTCLNPDTRSYTKLTGVGDVDRLYHMLGPNSSERKKLLLAR